MRFQSLVVLLLVLLASAARNQALPGGYSPINPNDPHVIEIANFAVTEYDNKKGTDLKLEKVIKGESETIAAGTNYRLTISAIHGSESKPNFYNATVYDKPSVEYRILLIFIPVSA